MIPKLAFTFWEGEQFTYLHYLTVVTFKKFNPDIEFIIYISDMEKNELIKWSSGEHNLIYTNTYNINNLSNIDGVRVEKINVNKELNYTGILSPVWKSDIIRILKLYEHGGIYIDFDTLFVSKVPDYIFSSDFEMAFNTYYNVINNAFIVSKKNSYICKIILDKIIYKLHNNLDNGYLQFGATLITPLIKNTDLEKHIYYIPNEETCPYLCDQMGLLFFSNNDLTTPKTFCIHWYNGSNESRKYNSNFNKDSIINSDNNIFEKKLSCILKN